jgi:FkbM family methyltransferase
MNLAKLVPSLRRYPARLKTGDTLVVDLSNRMSFQYFFFGELPNELVTAAVMRTVLSAGAGFIDVGANLGYYTRLAAHLVGPNGRVVAFEPVPETCRLLRRNTHEFGQVLAEEYAVADSEATVEFYVHPSADQSSLFPTAATRKISVPTRVLDDWNDRLERCDMIKMDIEGAEMAALRGARKLLARCKPLVFFEYAPETIGMTGATISDYERLFAGVADGGYTLWWANTPDEPLVALTHEHACDYLVALPRRLEGAFRLGRKD